MLALRTPNYSPDETATASAYVHRRHWSAPRTWDRERIVAALHDWTTYTGSPPRSYEWAPATAAGLGLTTPRVELWERHHPRWPSTSTVCVHFGRWSTALRAAGLEPHRAIAPGEQRAARVRAAKEMGRGGLPVAVVAGVLGVAPRTVRAYLNAGVCADCGAPAITARLCPKCAARRGTRPRATRAQVIRAIQAWHDETGAPPRSEDWVPTNDPQRKWAREYPRWPSYMTVRTHFGSWRAALDAAGRPRSRPSWDRAAIVAALRGLAAELGRQPVTRDLERTGMPAPATVRLHFGSLAAALEAAGLRPNRRRWRRDEILAAVAAFHRRHGRPPQESDWSRATAEHPHATTARRAFGSWEKLLAASTQ
jgi:hypothetical protein